MSLDTNAEELINNNREPIHWSRLEIRFEDIFGLYIYSVRVHLQIRHAEIATYSDWKKRVGYIAFNTAVLTWLLFRGLPNLSLALLSYWGFRYYIYMV